MLVVNAHISIPENLLTVQTSRSSGPGGQNVNKVETRVTLLFNYMQCDTITAAQKRLITQRLSGRILKEGNLRVVSQKHRTQLANKEAARARLVELISAAVIVKKKRIKRKMSKGAKERILQNKKHRSKLKSLRRTKPTL